MRKIDSGIARGLRENEFANLDPAVRHKLMRFIARIAEASFRRGLQHGDYFARQGRALLISPAMLRRDDRYPYDQAPWIDSKPIGRQVMGTSSLARLGMEHGGALFSLGFWEAYDVPDETYRLRKR